MFIALHCLVARAGVMGGGIGPYDIAGMKLPSIRPSKDDWGLRRPLRCLLRSVLASWPGPQEPRSRARVLLKVDILFYIGTQVCPLRESLSSIHIFLAYTKY